MQLSALAPLVKIFRPLPLEGPFEIMPGAAVTALQAVGDPAAPAMQF